jgi:hypothetical protein
VGLNCDGSEYAHRAEIGVITTLSSSEQSRFISDFFHHSSTGDRSMYKNPRMQARQIFLEAPRERRASSSPASTAKSAYKVLRPIMRVLVPSAARYWYSGALQAIRLGPLSLRHGEPHPSECERPEFLWLRLRRRPALQRDGERQLRANLRLWKAAISPLRSNAPSPRMQPGENERSIGAATRPRDEERDCQSNLVGICATGRADLSSSATWRLRRRCPRNIELATFLLNLTITSTEYLM